MPTFCCCCGGGGRDDKWPTDFKPTELSSNKCDAEWEEINGNPATFAMGSHWGPAARFGGVPGVIRVRVGFTGGTQLNPTYDDPKDHCEAINLQYDPDRVKYSRLLEIFWDYHDWSSEDNGSQYQSAIYSHDAEERAAAEESLLAMMKRTKKKIRTKISSYTQFWVSEDDYQHKLLQSQSSIFSKLKIPPAQMAHSHLATRLEAYVCGFAKPEAFDDEVAELYLPRSLATEIRALCVKNQPPEEGANKFPLS